MDRAGDNFTVFVAEHLPQAGWELLNAAADVAVAKPFESCAELMGVVSQADAIIIRSATKADAELFDAAKNLKVIAKLGAQIHNIDIEEATRRGIMVLNAPNANRYAIVEHTFALILALARQIPYPSETRQGEERISCRTNGFQLNGKILGLIGFGVIGQEIAARGQAFGMKTIAYDPFVDLSLAREQRVDILEFEDVLGMADVLTLQIGLNSQTRHIMNADTFSLMKPGAYLINCLHAGLVDGIALIDALDNGLIAGAAMDTFIEEPVSPHNPLIEHEKVITTPHLHRNTIESQNAIGLDVVADVLDILRGEDYRNVLNLPFTKNVSYRDTRRHILLGTKLGMLQGQLAEGEIIRVEVELIGDGAEDYIHAATMGLLEGVHNAVGKQDINWVNAPVYTHEIGIQTAQVKNLLDLPDYPSLMACRVEWQGGGSRLIAGALHAGGEARIIYYDGFTVDAIPEGYVLILENKDVPGVIGMVGTSLGKADINIGNWRYGREVIGGRAMSFISLDSPPTQELLNDLESQPVILHARLVRF
ncbi:MAG: NAD(P)-dependent oxidoreductase [Anaerolineales bacterium]|jgi:D-3-phosphoglycerate dehydrogenase